MSKVLQQIGEELRRIVGEQPLVIMSGKVVAVDEGEGTCEVCLTVDGPDSSREGITINAVTDNSNGVLVIPKVGSHVWVAEIDGPGKMGIIKTSDVSKVVVTLSGTPEVVIEPGKVVMNGGDNGGVPIAANVANEITEVINSVNALRNVLAAWVPVPNDGGAKLKTDLTASGWLSDALAPVTETDIANENVQH